MKSDVFNLSEDNTQFKVPLLLFYVHFNLILSAVAKKKKKREILNDRL